MSSTDYSVGPPLSVISTDLDNGVGRGTEDSTHWGKLIAAYVGFKSTHPGMMYGCIKNDGPRSISLRCVCTGDPNGYGAGADFATTPSATAFSFAVQFRAREAFAPQADPFGNNIAGNPVLTVPAGGFADFFIEAYVGGPQELANAELAQDYLLFFADETIEDFNSIRGSLTLTSFVGSLQESPLREVSALVVAPTPVQWTAP
jgi:hypothetical protein